MILLVRDTALQANLGPYNYSYLLDKHDLMFLSSYAYNNKTSNKF